MGKEVVCNLPEEKVFIQAIQLPKMKKEELNQAVKWEAEAHIPLGIDDVYLDWRIVELGSGKAGQINVSLAATPRSLVDSYLNFLKKSGLQPVALEPESIAIIRSLIRPDNLKPVVVVDLGATGTNFVVFSGLAIRFSSHVEISGQLFSETIVKELGVSEKEANQLKIKVGLDKTKEKGKVYRTLEPIANDLAKKINEYIAFCHSHSSDSGRDWTIKQVLLCGGDSLLLNLSDYLSKKLKLPVELGHPLTNVIGKGYPLSEKESITYTTAIGLALGNYV